MDTQAADLLFRMKTQGTKAVLSDFDLINNRMKKVAKASVDGSNSFNTSMENMGKNLSQFGRNTQWLGQRVTFGLSLPIALFGKQAVAVAVEIDKAYMDLRRVWSGSADDIDNKLKPAAIRLSNTFGLLQEDIVDVFSELSKADLGQTAEEMEALARLAAETSFIFGVDLAKSTDQIKALMLGFRFNVDDTAAALDAMNIIADKTAASEEGIMDTLRVLGGLARNVGLDVRELAAATAVFEANNLSASEGANAMKFVIQRIQNPTKKSAELLKAFNIDLNDNEFRTKRAGDQLQIFAKRFAEVKNEGEKAEDAFRSIVEADFMRALGQTSGKRQANRFLVLLEDMGMQFDENADSVSEFAKAMDVSGDASANAEFKLKQLEVTFGAQNIKLEIAKQKFRNLQAELGNKLLPIFTQILGIAEKLVRKFDDMSPATQDMIIKFGLLLVALGPVLMVLGSTSQVLGMTLQAVAKLSQGIQWLNAMMQFKAVTAASAWGSSLAGVAAFLTNPWVVAIAIAVAAIVGIIWIFRNKEKAISDTQRALENLAAAEEAYAGAQETFNQANLSVITSQERIEFLLGEINRLENEGQTTTIEYARLVAELAVENDNLANNQEAVVTAKESLDTALSDKTAMESFKSKMDELSGSALGIATNMHLALQNTNSLTEAEKNFAEQTIPIITGTRTRRGFDENHDGGMIHAANGTIIPGSSPLRDRVPVMAEQGEGIMSKKAVENLLKNGMMPQGQGTTYNINFSPGVMVATPGEQRSFAREIKKLISQDDSRYAQIGNDFTGLSTAN